MLGHTVYAPRADSYSILSAVLTGSVLVVGDIWNSSKMSGASVRRLCYALLLLALPVWLLEALSNEEAMQAIEKLYTSTKGSDWDMDLIKSHSSLYLGANHNDDWDFSKDENGVYTRIGEVCASWAGIECEDISEVSTISALKLYGGNLQGTIPKELGQLTDLTWLDPVSYTHLTLPTKA